MALEKELELYHKELPNWLSQEGRFVVICGDTVDSFFEAYEDALKAGYERFGIKPFLVKRIEAIEKVHSFTRNLEECHT